MVLILRRIDRITSPAALFSGLRLGLLAALLAGCASGPQVFTTDLTQQAGTYIVGYSTDLPLRRRMEDQLVADLASRDFIAYASHVDVPDLGSSSAQAMLRAANERGVAALVLINQVAADASDSLLEDPDRITPLHPDLQTFYNESRAEMEDVAAEDQPAFAEVNLFLVDGQQTRLFWSGTTWSFLADGRGGAIEELSNTIATQLEEAREQFVSTRRLNMGQQ